MPKLTKAQRAKMLQSANAAFDSLINLRLEMWVHWDDCSKKWQESEVGEEWQAAMDAAETAQTAVEDVLQELDK